MNTQDTETKINHLNEQTWNELERDPSSCLQLINDCLSESKEIRYDRGIGEALINRGRVNFHLLNYQQALADFKEAHNYFHKEKWTLGKIRLFDQTGLVNAALGETDKAIEYYEESLIGSRLCSNLEMEISIQANLGNTYLNAEKFNQAIPFFTELENSLPENDRLNRIKTYNCLAKAYLGLKNYEKSLSFAEKALSEECSDRDRIKMIESLEIKGRIFAGLGDITQAIKTFEASITLCELVSHKSGKAQILYSMGNTFLSAGQYDVAIQNIQHAIALFDELGSNLFLAQAFKDLSLAFEKKGEYDQALLFQKLYFSNQTELLKKENERKIEYVYIARELERIEDKAERLAATNNLLQEENTRMKTLMEIGQQITSSLDLKRLLKPLYHHLNTLMESCCFGIGTFQEESNSINYDLFISNGKKMKFKTEPLSLESSLSSWCIIHNKDIFIDDFEKQWPNFLKEKPSESDLKRRSILYAPLTVEDRILGFITTQTAREFAYTDADLGTFKILASYIAIAMDNARIHSEVQSLYHDVVKEHKNLEASYRVIESMAVRDKLTGLYNRQYLEQLIENEFCENIKQSPYCILYLDLDNFKPINDNYGHFTGDIVLKEIAERLQNCMRQSDELIRIGGDEFVAVMRMNKNKDAAGRVAENIVKKLVKPVKIKTGELQIGISIGISIFPDDGNNIKELIKKADMTMYEVKRNGKGSYDFYS